MSYNYELLITNDTSYRKVCQTVIKFDMDDFNEIDTDREALYELC